jgi:S-adenosylmethionine:tRNA ribosyltransferase-isomerase
MYRQDFFYDLPPELIAQYPAQPRSSSRLLAYLRQHDELMHHQHVLDLVDYLNPGDLLISNDTKVLPARFFAKKTTGGHVEVLFERLLADNRMLCHMRSSKSAKIGSKIVVNDEWQLTVLGRHEDLFEVKVNGLVVDLLYACGHMPLPPYIERADEASDVENYQTIFAEHEGSVAAPTAGLHFDSLLMEKLNQKNISMMSVTLHVGAGTFKPVRADLIKDHIMHYEWYDVSDAVIQQIQDVKQNGGRVIAVGTTSLRALESAARDDFKTKQGLTNLFITPGYQFKVIDGLMTNFHLPESTLLMLVAALIGHEKLMDIYQEAVKQKYRFFSYGDACLFL